jgi:hypothetical protein
VKREKEIKAEQKSAAPLTKEVVDVMREDMTFTETVSERS